MNDGESRYHAACRMLDEGGSEESRQQAMALLKEAAAWGHVPSVGTLGVLYADRGDLTSALPYLVKAADHGNQGALDALASLYRGGDYAIREQIARSAAPATYRKVSFIKGDKPARSSRMVRLVGGLFEIVFDFGYRIIPRVVVTGIFGYAGFATGMEYCPRFCIVPVVLGAIGAGFGFIIGKHFRWKCSNY